MESNNNAINSSHGATPVTETNKSSKYEIQE